MLFHTDPRGFVYATWKTYGSRFRRVAYTDTTGTHWRVEERADDSDPCVASILYRNGLPAPSRRVQWKRKVNYDYDAHGYPNVLAVMTESTDTRGIHLAYLAPTGLHGTAPDIERAKLLITQAKRHTQGKGLDYARQLTLPF